MNLINKGDFLESYSKVKQRGINYFFSKINPNPQKRTQSTFSLTGTTGSNWWIITDVKLRENEKLSGDTQKTFDTYLAENYFQDRIDLKLLSIACGVGNREIKMAESGLFKEILGIDLSGESIKEATRKAKEKKLDNIRFEQADFYLFDLNQNHYDVILFYSALHHFKHIEQIAQRVSHALKTDGYLVLNEYVGKNRLQFSKDQVLKMNQLLEKIPSEYRTRYMTNWLKKKIYVPGLLRMIISDPSEAVESETIRPIIHKNFKIVEEKKIGGDLLMMVLKDIAHHFTNNDDSKSRQILSDLFQEEDKYLEKVENADFIFGIYQKMK
jgi:2-polyprenyl-3-methyl-5-hydroxy-6-metoxy-1,4-benzoquinol methylase